MRILDIEERIGNKNLLSIDSLRADSAIDKDKEKNFVYLRDFKHQKKIEKIIY